MERIWWGSEHDAKVAVEGLVDQVRGFCRRFVLVVQDYGEWRRLFQSPRVLIEIGRLLWALRSISCWTFVWWVFIRFSHDLQTEANFLSTWTRPGTSNLTCNQDLQSNRRVIVQGMQRFFLLGIRILETRGQAVLEIQFSSHAATLALVLGNPCFR